ncbi:epidermal cell surface receptor-like protein [Leptotrombidium deliense]|uniref:Epidermal cell surface receptor-like protein n=1 Tax=Leptotrombidium deliense TaxID=299467 RepID=A0A443SV26_9ACAR|nr:epidermal cell surface receptor-like protein [Leptotrombidium deliense]
MWRDAYDLTTGCEPQVTTKKTLLCSFKNKTYEPGTEFFDGCESKCVCSEALEIECSARCAFTVLKGGQLMPHVPNCTIIPDPKDSCCKLIVCDSKTDNETIAVNNGNSSTDTFVDAVPVDKPILAIGCHHKNKVYSINETFNEGCESICKCKHGSKLECKARCPTFQGNDRKYCQLMPDPDDPECCKIAVCDVREGERKQNPSIILDSAEPLNSHSANIRIILPKFENNSNEINLQILHAKVDSEADSMDTEKLDLHWQTESVQNESLKAVGNNAFEMKLSNLSASTEFFVKVINAADNSSSNTVVVRTFPAGVDHSFNGCFHGNKTFEIGEQFFDGCEYKCVCREGGLRECEERCPVYIDTVGYENCDWRPAPDDSCCTVPICDKQVPKMPKIPEPDSSQVCVGKDEVIHTLDDSWEEGDGCLKRRCKCVLLSNSTVAEECSGGCASIPPSALKPTLECHKPELVVPEDSCLCPYVVCNHSVNRNLPPQLPGPIRPPVSAPKTPKDHVIHNKQMCDYKGRKIEIGEEFHDGCRAICHCGVDTEVHCALIECPHNFGSHVSECFEWDVDPNFVATPPDCCPPPKCKNDGSCTFAGLRLPNFKAVPQHLLPCGTSCVCVNGNVTCDNQCPPLMDIPPASLPCPSSMAFRGYLPGDTCCMHWMCRGNERPVYCSQNGKRYKLGEQWDDQSVNGIISRRRCQCKAGAPGQQPIVQCYPGQCPQITDRHVKPSPECPIPVVVTPDDPIMCPYVVCNYSEDAGHNRVNGKDLENVSFISLNATTVRVRFTLPSLLVGLIGHAELHYTTDPSTPGNQWSVQKFARPKRLFDTSNIEYHLTSLRPDTEYYFQIRIIIEALQSGPESEVYKLRLPPVPTIKPTTTEMPPIISIDAQLNVKPVDSTTVLISWRPLEIHEKNIIDGLQILYKRSEQSDKEWLKTPTIHREVNSYVLRDLLSGLSYTFDLFFITAEPFTTKIVSTKSVTVKLPTKPRDEFDFAVQVEQSDIHTDSSRCVVHLRRLPIPVNKYVNVVKISYKNVDAKSDTPLLQMFRVPSVDGTVTLDGLQPQKHYKAWFDLYLANGHVITANAFDFNTKEAVKSGSNHVDSDQTNDAEALRESSANEAEIIRPYYVALTVVTLFAIITGIGFVAILCVLMRTKCSAKAPITRAPSESAYDNPTYKTYDGDRPVEEAIKNSVTA